MPGKDSLKHNQYYGHSRNAFWKILFSLLNQPFTNDYPQKQALLLQNKIALWDVLKSCERETSLDSDINNEYPNDIAKFLSQNAQINHLFFNGNAAFLFYKKHIKNVALPITVLPSTSPAHAISFEQKLKAWQQITHLL